MMFLVHLEISFRILKLEFVIVFETIFMHIILNYYYYKMTFGYLLISGIVFSTCINIVKKSILQEFNNNKVLYSPLRVNVKRPNDVQRWDSSLKVSLATSLNNKTTTILMGTQATTITKNLVTSLKTTIVLKVFM